MAYNIYSILLHIHKYSNSESSTNSLQLNPLLSFLYRQAKAMEVAMDRPITVYPVR